MVDLTFKKRVNGNHASQGRDVGVNKGYENLRDDTNE